MDLEKKIAKIKKCLELSKSANEHEAANAISAAQRYMKAYGLTEADIELSSIGGHLTQETIQRKPKMHICELMHAIDRAFGVDSVYSFDQEKGKRVAQFYGEKHVAMLAAYAFDVCMGLIKRARREYIASLHKNCSRKTKEARADAFSMGFVRGINSNLAKMDITPDTRSKMDMYKAKEFGSLKEVRSQDTTRRIKGQDARARLNEGFNAGYRDGLDVRLHQPVSSSEPQKLIS